MKIVITGALGHIGSRLIRDLPAAFPDADILMLDSLLTQRYCSLFDLPTHGHYRFFEGDILTADLQTLFRDAAVVIHLAAITDATTSFEKKGLVDEVNVRGSELVANACAQGGCPMIAVSTTSVYGSQSSEVDEACADTDLKPQSPYAESKLQMEQMLAQKAQTQGLRFVVCRFGTIFGASPGMRFHTAVNKFVWQACVGQPLTVWRTAWNQKRPYLDLGDAVRALCFIVEAKRFDGEVYNVLTLNAAVADIVHAVKACVDDVRVEYVDSPIMNQLSYEVNMRKFTRLGFYCQGDLGRGVEESVAMLRRARSARSMGV